MSEHENIVPPSDEAAADDTPPATAVEAMVPSFDAQERRIAEPSLNMVQRSHVGSVRRRNEDNCFAFSASSGGQEPLLPFGLYIVADGMGGHQNGHIASRRAARIVAREVLSSIYLPLLAEGSGPPVEPVREIMLRAVQSANTTIHSLEPEQDAGTTVTAGLIFGKRLYLAHVGDSRAYLWCNDQLKVITNDHSYVQRLLEAGQLTLEEAAVHPQRHVLYRAVGQGGHLEVDTYTQTLPDKGMLLLCTDGLWGLIPEPLIQTIITSGNPLNVMADSLVELALEAGGGDNITLVLVDFEF